MEPNQTNDATSDIVDQSFFTIFDIIVGERDLLVRDPVVFLAMQHGAAAIPVTALTRSRATRQTTPSPGTRFNELAVLAVWSAISRLRCKPLNSAIKPSFSLISCR